MKVRKIARRVLTHMGLRTAPYVLKALKAGYQDVNDYLEFGNDGMAQNAMRQFFSYDVVRIRSGKILEVGAGTGRFTREIVKYVPEDVSIVSLEYQYEAYYFLKKYAGKNWKNVTVLLGDFFNNPFEDEEFDLVLIPWFSMTMSLYRWGKLLQESARILKKSGLLGFDFMDSQDRLLEVISRESNFPYFLVNGKDLEIIARHFGLTKVLEFNEGFNEQIAKYHLYAKRES